MYWYKKNSCYVYKKGPDLQFWQATCIMAAASCLTTVAVGPTADPVLLRLLESGVPALLSASSMSYIKISINLNNSYVKYIA